MALECQSLALESKSLALFARRVLGVGLGLEAKSFELALN